MTLGQKTLILVNSFSTDAAKGQRLKEGNINKQSRRERHRNNDDVDYISYLPVTGVQGYQNVIETVLQFWPFGDEY